MQVGKKLMTPETALGKIILEEEKPIVKDFTEILFGLHFWPFTF